jgi:hypothetical protein
MSPACARHLAIASLIGACGNPPAPSSPLESRVIATPPMSCALPAPRRSPVELVFYQWIGTVAGRSWLIAKQGFDKDGDDTVLVTLDDAGALAITALPAHDRPGAPWFTVATVVGNQLWLPLTGDHGDTTYVYDLTSAHPVGHEVVIAGRTNPGPSELAVSATRALFQTTQNGSPMLELIDRRRDRLLATTSYAKLGFDPAWMRCLGDECFALDLASDATGRLLTSFRFAADGTVTRETLDLGNIESFSAVADGDRTRVTWTSSSLDRPGVFARTLDASGHARAPAITLRASHVDWMYLLSTAPPTFAYADAAGWHSAAIGEHGAEPPRSMGLPKTEHLAVAPTPDGLAVTGYNSQVAIDSSVPPSQLFATFVPNDGRPEPPIDLLFGVRHSSWVAFPLVAPGYVAALTLQAGYGPIEGELITLRVPCPR